MASVKAIDSRSIHQIQSGQVIVDLTSVVKELVENSLDAGATSLDVRFKTYGLDAIEIQDNGAGISANDYESIALKHFTSKLSNYDELTSLETFGFRGEALSSLCGVSMLHIVTAQDGEAPKGTRLDFEPSGVLSSTSIAACQKGTTVVVEELFHDLPVRRRELEKNIKREYSKVLGLLHAYACISTKVKITVSNLVAKGKKVVVFATNANATTRENIANVYGAKTIGVLMPLNLDLQLQPTVDLENNKDGDIDTSSSAHQVRVVGHVSRPVFGEGRQAPDRQMYFVNSRPCGLPQISKVFNEVYKSFNYSQSPFVFANFLMSTKAYDVNVSPDKRTILLHDQSKLLDSLKEQLHVLFDVQDQTMPHSQLLTKKQLAPQALFDPLSARDASSVTNSAGPDTVILENIPLSNKEDDASLEQGRIINEPSQNEAHNATNSAAASNQANYANRVADLHRMQLDEISPEREDVRSDNHTEDGFSSPQRVQAFKLRSAGPRNLRQGLHQHDDSLPRGSYQQPSDPDAANIQTPNKRRRLPLIDFPNRSSVQGFTSALDMFTAHGTPKLGTTAVRNMEYGAEETISMGSASDLKHGLASQEAETMSEGEDLFVEPGGNLFPEQDAQNGHDDSDADSSDLYLKEGETTSKQRGVDGADKREKAHKVQEEERIQSIVSKAEAMAARSTGQKRLQNSLKNFFNRESTIHLTRVIRGSTEGVQDQICRYMEAMERSTAKTLNIGTADNLPARTTEEERLSLTVSKSDFGEMRVIGQFNLGFILAVRAARAATSSTRALSDDLFIIDQHASDEIFNFSKLYKSTSLTPQPLVHPHTLQLTAIEEETIFAHADTTLVRNGFNVAVDTSGSSPVGQRCKLLTVPTSRETVFGLKDLEELLAMLGEAPAPTFNQDPPRDGMAITTQQQHLHEHGVIRPSKVRRMLAMRACRSSIMVGRTLTMNGMRRVVRHMGEIERPWNCPHGRPTMRHLASLSEWQSWNEQTDGSLGQDDDMMKRNVWVREDGRTDWPSWLQAQRESNG